MAMDVSAMVTASLRDDPERIGFEFDGQSLSCGSLTALIDPLQRLFDDAGIALETPVALIARNRPAPATALLGLVEARRAVSNIYAFQSSEAVAGDLDNGRYQVVVAEDRDWSEPVIEAARRTGSMGISLSFGAAEPATAVPGLERPGPGPFRDPLPEPGLEILSSGTTGPPKRIAIPNRVLARSVRSMIDGGATAGGMAPDLVIWPIAGVGGSSCVIGDFAIKRTIVLFERFALQPWLEALARYNIPVVNTPPTVLRMILDAGTPPEALSSLKYIFGGGAALSPELQDEFEEAYGIPLIWAYGATEFSGTLTTWTPRLYEEFKTAKRGSIGKAFTGTELRIVDPETGDELPTGEIGLVEARAAEIGPAWVRTTDLAYVDEDGFLFHQGRADGAIVRGGFKVLPHKIDDALREHPAVFDAATVAIDDRRLGQVPASAVELARGADKPTVEELDTFLRARLTPQYIPTEIRILDKMPRTTSLKPNLGELREMFEAG